MTARGFRRRWPLFAVALLGACATLAPRPLPPAAEVAAVRFARFVPGDTRIGLLLNVHNPNPYPLAVDAAEATIAIEGTPLATGTLAAPARLPAGGDAQLAIEARAEFAALTAALDRVAREGRARYELTGSATIAGGTRLPFTRRGELPLAAWLGGLR